MDFSQIGDGAVEVSDDRRSVAITLPAPALDKTNLDSERSYVFAQQRGILDRSDRSSPETPAISNSFTSWPSRRSGARRKAASSSLPSGTPAPCSSDAQLLGFTNVTVKFARRSPDR